MKFIDYIDEKVKQLQKSILNKFYTKDIIDNKLSNINIDTSNLLDKDTYKGSKEGVVKKADKITTDDKTIPNSVYSIDVNGNEGWYPKDPLVDEITPYKVNSLTKGIAQAFNFNTDSIAFNATAYEKQSDEINHEEIFEQYINPIVTTHSDEVEISEIDGVQIMQIKDDSDIEAVQNDDGFYEYTLNLDDFISIKDIAEKDGDN